MDKPVSFRGQQIVLQNQQSCQLHRTVVTSTYSACYTNEKIPKQNTKL